MGEVMKKNEEMYGTNRMAIKLNDGSKVYIDRICIDDLDRYILSISNNSYINGVSIDDYSIIIFKKMLIDNYSITLKTIIQENMAFKEVYYVDDGFLDTRFRSYIPMKEENTSSREMFLELANVREISTDLDMFKDMIDDKRVIAKTEDLSRFGIYFPQIKVLKKETLAKNK